MAPLRDCAHLYSTNAVPNPQEAKAVQQKVDNLKNKIGNLKSQLQELEEELRQHEAVLSPVRRIPAEVLGEVFSLVLPVTLDHQGREQLLDFCLVCKLWRDAALAAGWIWGSVSVDINGELAALIHELPLITHLTLDKVPKNEIQDIFEKLYARLTPALGLQHLQGSTFEHIA
ncbi:hypothetical protein H1R20_g4749, partial [Candolleomyces eurysporus]